ncbi:MAG: hypothetical protein IKZ93_00470, partial [Prevotella sp.]|nr:hypothetical protein [Prevotella sp.]
KDKQMISRLKRMAASDKIKDYLDQVYYAIGNIYLSKRDTLKAIEAYEKGNTKATRSGIEKGVLLLHLGDLYWARENFSDARRCYGEAIGLLDKDRDDYEQLSNRSKVLDELVPHTDAIHLQDSLQALAKMSEDDRNAAIDRVIEALKKKEKEERNRLAEEEVRKQQAGGENFDDIIPNDGPTPARQQQPQQQQGNSIWYFYNPTAVNQGKSNFQRLWGKRENVDDWQRINKTVVAGPTDLADMTDEQRDSLEQATLAADSLAQATDSVQNDPHKREYYLAQIPFTEEQVEESNMIIKDGLYHSGVIFKDKLDNLRLSEKQLRRLTDQYPDFEHMDDVFYHLWLLYQRKLQPQIADTYLDQLKEHYPESQWTTLLKDPYFEENARFGAHIEDSLYAATYAAFKAGRLTEVRTNTILSAQRFPIGEHRDKFIFIGGLAKLNDGDGKGCVEDMQTVVKDYPQSDVSALAGMIINGVNAGRRLHGGKFDMGDVWTRRSEVLQDSDSIAARVFTAERNDRFVFMMAYEPDSVNENQLLYELARFNFTSFMVRNFDIEVEDIDGLHRMRISGFLNYDEAWQYARQLYKNEAVTRLLRKARMILISEPNLELLGTQYSYNDYDDFYEEHFVPLKISTVQLLTEPADLPVEEETFPSTTQEQEELLNGGVLDDNTLIDLGIDPNPSVELEVPEEKNEVPAEEPTQPTPAPQQPEVGIEIPAEEPSQPEVGIEIPSEDVEIPSDVIEIPSNNVEIPSDIIEIPNEDPVSKPATQPLDEPVFEITDDPADTPAPSGTVVDIEDEYYELDGF